MGIKEEDIAWAAIEGEIHEENINPHEKMQDIALDALEGELRKIGTV